MRNKFVFSGRPGQYVVSPFHTNYNYAGKEYDYSDRDICWHEDKDCIRDSFHFSLLIWLLIIIIGVICCCCCYCWILKCKCTKRSHTNIVDPVIKIGTGEKDPEAVWRANQTSEIPLAQNNPEPTGE